MEDAEEEDAEGTGGGGEEEEEVTLPPPPLVPFHGNPSITCPAEGPFPSRDLRGTSLLPRLSPLRLTVAVASSFSFPLLLDEVGDSARPSPPPPPPTMAAAAALAIAEADEPEADEEESVRRCTDAEGRRCGGKASARACSSAVGMSGGETMAPPGA